MKLLVSVLLFVACLGDLVAESQRAQQLFLSEGPTLNVLNEYTDLITRYEKSEGEKEPGSMSQLYFKKSLIEINLGREKDAINDLKTCLEYDPTLKPAQSKLVDLLVEHSMLEDPVLLAIKDKDTEAKINKFNDDYAAMVDLCEHADGKIDRLQACNEIIENELLPVVPYNTSIYKHYIKNLETLQVDHPDDSRKIVGAYVKLLKCSMNTLDYYVQLSSYLLYTQVNFQKAFNNVKQCLRIDNEYKDCAKLSKLYSKFKKLFDNLENYSNELSHLYLQPEGDSPTIPEIDLSETIDFPFVIEYLNDKPTKRQLAGISGVSTNYDYLWHHINEFHQQHNLHTSKLAQDVSKLVCEAYITTKDYKGAKQYCDKVDDDLFFPKVVPDIDRLLAKKRYPQADALMSKFPVNVKQTQLFRSRWAKVEEYKREQLHKQQQQQQQQQQQRFRQQQQQQQQQRQAMQKPKNDYYKVLDVPRDADEKTIKKGYRTQTLKYHPDKYKGSDMSAEDMEAKMQEINQAYEVLSNAELRERYDRGDDPNDPMGGQSPGQGSPFGFGGSPFGSQFRSNGGGFQFSYGTGSGGGGNFFNFGGFGGNGKGPKVKFNRKRRH